MGKIKRNILEDTTNKKFGCRAETLSGFVFKASNLIDQARCFFLKNVKETKKRTI